MDCASRLRLLLTGAEEMGQKASAVNPRNQILLTLSGGNPKVETLARLSRAVNAEIQSVVTRDQTVFVI